MSHDDHDDSSKSHLIVISELFKVFQDGSPPSHWSLRSKSESHWSVRRMHPPHPPPSASTTLSTGVPYASVPAPLCRYPHVDPRIGDISTSAHINPCSALRTPGTDARGGPGSPGQAAALGGVACSGASASEAWRLEACSPVAHRKPHMRSRHAAGSHRPTDSAVATTARWGEMGSMGREVGWSRGPWGSSERWRWRAAEPRAALSSRVDALAQLPPSGRCWEVRNCEAAAEACATQSSRSDAARAASQAQHVEGLA